MGGLIKWLKKDSTARTRRRESAPIPFFTKQRPTNEEAYRESLIRFTKFRENERLQRLSLGANEMAAYHSISNDGPSLAGESTTPTDQRQPQYRSSTCPPKSHRSHGNATNRHDITPKHNGHRTKKFSVQFHLSESTEESDLNYDNQSTLRMMSMPAASSSNGIHARGMRHRGRTTVDSRTIIEEDIEAFESAHCGSVNDDDQTSYHSPPTKFYMQNSNPFPSTSETSSVSAMCDVQPTRGKCPEKPKRLMLNSKQSRKLLTEAHFTGAYRNFEIQSPYYSDSSSAFSIMGKQNYASTTDVDSDAKECPSTPPDHYQVIVNKYGDEVEYALPCIDAADFHKRKKSECLTSDDSILAGEVFNTNPSEFDRLLNENYEMGSDAFQARGSIMITDLDKSTDQSTATLNDIDAVRRDERLTNRVSYFHEAMQHATDVICLISDFNSVGKMEAKMETPLHFEWGIFKTTKVTVRKYAEIPFNDNINSDFTLIAETAIIRDAEVLRKVRHSNIINLMAVAFEPDRRLALIMEPTKFSLNHYLFVKNEQLTIKKVITVMRKMADAVQYLHEFDICHSNISSHAILIDENVSQIKLTSFELAVPFKSDIQNDSELKSKYKPLHFSSIRSKQSPKLSLSSEQKIERYRLLSAANPTNKTELNYCVPFIRDISTKYFPYCTDYRRKLSLFNYQAPELLSQTEPFVFPTKHSDTYALTLLLWELLNQCIPFVIYDEAKLSEMLKTNYPLKFLPIVEEERCQRFHDILERGLKREPDTRIDLDKMIRKLASIETETGHDYEKDQHCIKCCGFKVQSGKGMPRRSIQDDEVEKMTPDKSTSKLFSIISSPKPSPIGAMSANTTVSPLNNVTSNTFHRSILDFNKLLSPRRDTNEERNSTIKRRKKVTASSTSRRNAKDLFGADLTEPPPPTHEPKAMAVNVADSSLSSGRPSSEFNNALTESAINKVLEYTKDNKDMVEPIEKPVPKRIEQPFGPKDTPIDADQSKQTNPNNSSNQLIVDGYVLPQELIARNNKIRRYTWLSSDQINSSMQYEQHSTAGNNKCDDISMLPTLNESTESSKKLNVSIKIVHTHLTPEKKSDEQDSLSRSQSNVHNESIKSNCSLASAASSEDSFSVKSRIKFFRSLESQPVQRRTPNKSKMNISRRSEMSFNEAKKAIEKAQRRTYPTSKRPENANQQLIKEITEITADIKNCLSKNKHLKEHANDDNQMSNDKQLSYLLNADINEADESMALLIDDLLNQKNLIDENTRNESGQEESEKRNSVRETVQKFESSLRNEKNDKSFSIQKIENKLLNEKIFNTDSKFDGSKRMPSLFSSHDDKDGMVTDEKVEDVIRIEAPSEAENEAGSRFMTDDNDTVPENDSQQSQQTLIKRTFYQESIISGTNVDMPELKTLLVSPPNVTAAYATTHKSSLTTRVTLNMRKCRRRSSDVGSLGQNIPDNNFSNEAANSSRMVDIRHSICGSPLPFLNQENPVEPTSGRRLEQISDERYRNHASGFMVSNDQLHTSILSGIFNGKQIQSIEDLYIDDDFGGSRLAANMKLMTNSTDTLDNINFDLISTHVFQQTSESMMASNLTNANGTLNAIEGSENDDNTDNNQ